MKTIAELNDEFRKRYPNGSGYMVSAGLATNWEVLPEIMELVKSFDKFDEDNDPWGEHDFGSFEHRGLSIIWKIDYVSGPPDSPDCRRVLTVMLAEEY